MREGVTSSDHCLAKVDFAKLISHAADNKRPTKNVIAPAPLAGSLAEDKRPIHKCLQMACRRSTAFNKASSATTLLAPLGCIDALKAKLNLANPQRVAIDYFVRSHVRRKGPLFPCGAEASPHNGKRK